MNAEFCDAIINDLHERLNFLISESFSTIRMFESAIGLCTLALFDIKKIFQKQGYY
jgi:hypothetical protein